MNKQSRRVLCLGRFAALGGLLSLLAPSATFGAITYLCEVGPPTIRIDSIYQRGTVVPTEFSYDESKPKPPPTVSSAKDPTLAIVSTNQTGRITQAFAPFTGTNNPPSVPPEPQPSPAASQPSVQDITVVTPQMLMDFLRPGIINPADADGKRPALFYPGKFDFTPPLEVNRSSTAVYKKE